MIRPDIQTRFVLKAPIGNEMQHFKITTYHILRKTKVNISCFYQQLKINDFPLGSVDFSTFKMAAHRSC